ncbi:MAG TPA: hypothetical protein VGQ83_12550 [Polyangia bacterium]|jgi:hypothetical protein
MLRALPIVFAAMLACAACGAVDTDDGHYPGMSELTGADFHLHYPNPPWIAVPQPSTYGAYQPLLWVPAVYFGISLDLNAYLLQVDPVPGRAVDVIQALRATALTEGEVLDFDMRPLRTSAGDAGYEIGSHGGQLEARLPKDARQAVDDQGFTVRARRAVFDGPSGAFVVLVVSVYDLSSPEMTYMLQSFEPRLPARDGGAVR